MTTAQKQQGTPFDLDEFAEMLDRMETASIPNEDPLDSDEARAQALDRRVKEADAAVNAAYYEGKGDCAW